MKDGSRKSSRVPPFTMRVTATRDARQTRRRSTARSSERSAARNLTWRPKSSRAKSTRRRPISGRSEWSSTRRAHPHCFVCFSSWSSTRRARPRCFVIFFFLAVCWDSRRKASGCVFGRVCRDSRRKTCGSVCVRCSIDEVEMTCRVRIASLTHGDVTVGRSPGCVVFDRRARDSRDDVAHRKPPLDH